MKTQAELRAFVLGAIFGIIATVGSFAFVCWMLNIKWQPVIGG